MKTFDREDDYISLVNSLDVIIDNFMMATASCLEYSEARELQTKLEEVLLSLRYAKG